MITVARLHANWVSIPTFPTTESKFARILELCEGKDVLDCGCVGSRVEDAESMAGTSHYQIALHARRCVGVDIDATEVSRRKAMGYDVRVGNAETLNLGETFDVVVAADLVEHLSNPGAFLDRALIHLRPGGLLCLVTPNAWSANGVFKAILGVSTRVNPEHTCWYDPVTLRQLLERHQFEPVEWYWQDYRRRPLQGLISRIRPNLSAHVIVIARRLDGGSL